RRHVELPAEQIVRERLRYVIVLGSWRWLVHGPLPGLEVRQEAVVKEAAHRSPSLGRTTDSPGPPRTIRRIPAHPRPALRGPPPPADPAAGPDTVEHRPGTLRYSNTKVTKMYRAYRPPTFTGATPVGYGADGPYDPHRRTSPDRTASAESGTAARGTRCRGPDRDLG